MDSKFYTVYPACDVIKINLIINKAFGGWLVSFGNKKHVIKI